MNLFTPPVEIVREKKARAPQVSVIVTLYDYGHFLDACLDSIRAQTQKDLELVVVDDHSSDGGLGIATRWLARNEDALAGYRLLHHTKNMGLAYARNTAFAHAAAPYVFVMDADNMLYPKAIERCLDAIKASRAAAVFTQLEFFDERHGVGWADYWSVERLKRGNYIDAMALVDKKAWEKVGGYTQMSADGWEDYDFWCKFVEHDLHAVFIPEMLCRYRWHGQSMSANETRPRAPALILEMSMRHPWLEL
ncbi:MAG: glycosyltransferase [Alphaproteobacteria bacterium]|nr:glycosyltransferase [Alphaproteobacteria bacterium]